MSNIEDELLIQELEESVKQDEMNKMWEAYGPYLVACAVLVVLITAFFTFWGNYNERTNAHNTEIIMSALEQKENADILSGAVEDFKPDQKFIALFITAGQLLQSKDYSAAIQNYKKIAADNGVSPVFRDLATLMMVRTEWSYGNKKSDGGVYLGQLKPLLTKKDGPWYYHASVQSAMISAHELQDYKRARQYLLPVLGSNNVPPSLGERAKALDHVYYLREHNMLGEAPATDNVDDIEEAVSEESKG